MYQGTKYKLKKVDDPNEIATRDGYYIKNHEQYRAVWNGSQSENPSALGHSQRPILPALPNGVDYSEADELVTDEVDYGWSATECQYNRYEIDDKYINENDKDNYFSQTSFYDAIIGKTNTGTEITHISLAYFSPFKIPAHLDCSHTFSDN